MQATLSHYRIVEEIGAGGMGVVYRAHDERLNRDVALKVLPSGALADEAAHKRFRKEALALSKLNHPNIAVVHDFDTQDGTDFLVEELISGLSLNEMLLSGPLPEREIIALGTQMCEGLAAAHEQGVIHRDLKPGNIRVTPDARLKILDFGLAKVLRPPAPDSNTAPTASLTETQTVSGTFPYMAPEQLMNEKLDTRTDIWAAGCVLYEIATGQRPFLGAGPALTDAILHHPPKSPSALHHKVSPGLQAIILKCLEKDPALRYASARDIAVDLHRLAITSSGILPAAPPRHLRKRGFFLTGILLAVLVIAATVVYLFTRRPALQPLSPSIAVLPFVDMSPGRDQEYLADGLAEELLSALAKMPELRVTARTSSFQFKGKNEDLRVIGGRLNVATVLEGSVRKQGNRVRITAQLIKVSDGYHLWSETYDRDLKDVFAVQEEIARSVAGSLQVTLLGARVPSAQATTPEAYNAYLQGRYFQEKVTKENLEKAIAFYQQAVNLDPRYAPAWAALSWTRSHMATEFSSWPELQEELNNARQDAERALALDPNLAAAHHALGYVKVSLDWDWEGADACYRRARALEPGNTGMLVAAAELAGTLNRFDEALRLDQQAIDLDPLRPTPYHVMALHLWWAGRLDEAETAVQKTLQLDPGFPWSHLLLSRLYLARSRPETALVEAERETIPEFRLQALALANHALGRKQESDRALAELITKYQAGSAFQIAEVYGVRGQADQVFEWLERAYTQHDAGLRFLKGDPMLRNIEHDPRYAAFLRKMRLPLT